MTQPYTARYIAQLIPIYQVRYRQYLESKAKGLPLWEISQFAYERCAFLNIDAWVSAMWKIHKTAIKRYAAGKHDKIGYTEREVFVIESLYYLKKGEKAPWNGMK